MKKIGMILVILLAVSMSAFARGEVEAEPYPSQTVRVIVPYSAGGGSDVFSRTIGQYIDTKGQPYVVTNIAGAGGSLGVTEVLNSKPDGHIVLFHSITALVGGYYGGLYDTKIFEEFSPIAAVFASYYGVLVRSDSPYQTLQQLIDYGVANPNRLTMAIAGFGGAAHIAALNFADAAGVQLNMVPYSGAADVRAALEGGHADVAILATMESFDFVQAGKFIQFAHSAPRRIASVDAPTFIESGINFTFTHRNGYLVLKNTPQEAIDFLETEIRKVAENPEFINIIEARGAFVDFLGVEEFQAYLYELDSMIEPFADLMK